MFTPLVTTATVCFALFQWPDYGSMSAWFGSIAPLNDDHIAGLLAAWEQRG